MSRWNVGRGVSRVGWMLLALWLPVLVQADPVSKFVVSGDQVYLEVGARKVITESRGDYRAMMVLGEGNNPELLKFSYADGSRKIATVVVELRSEEGVPSPGLQVDNEFVRSLSSDEDGFADWQARFSSFPEQTTETIVVTDATFGDPIEVAIFDEKGGITARLIRNWLCHCRAGLCFSAAAHCLRNYLCTSWDCIETGDWGPVCEEAIREARRCMAVIK